MRYTISCKFCGAVVRDNPAPGEVIQLNAETHPCFTEERACTITVPSSLYDTKAINAWLHSLPEEERRSRVLEITDNLCDLCSADTTKSKCYCAPGYDE